MAPGGRVGRKRRQCEHGAEWTAAAEGRRQREHDVFTAPETQQALHELLIREGRAITEHVQRLAATLTPQELAWLPPDKGWSIAQVFEHMCIVHDSYLERIEEFLEGESLPQREGGKDAPWSPRFAGAFLVRALTSPRKVPAPRKYRVGPRIRAHVIAAFLERQKRLDDALARAEPLEWRACRLGSPMASVIRLNLGDAFLVAAVHARRHLGQVERLRAAMATAATNSDAASA